MAIPNYETIMLPLLKFLRDKHEYSLRQAIDTLANQFSLTSEERRELLSSGQQAIFNNRVGWARTYMKKAGLVESARRGYFQITAKGSDVLKQNPGKIDAKFLLQFKEFREFKTFRRDKAVGGRDVEGEEEKTPLEALESAYQSIRNGLATDLLQQIKVSSPSLFENIVIELLVKMGYGGSRRDAAEAVGKIGDEGIDGTIKEDPLGLDIIYIQAKKWENTVGRPEIQRFAGALQGKRARKGIFITTSDYSREAYEYVSNIDTKIVLIDGDRLAQLMIDNNIGVSPSTTYELKKLDLDYFTEE